MDIKETGALLTIIAEAYQNFTPSETTASVWASILGDVTALDAKKAILEIVRVDKYPPTPARVLEVVREGMAQPEEQPSIIWERLVQLASQGERGKAIFDAHESPRVKSALYSIGGFSYLRRAEISSLPYIRRDFLTAYQERKTFEEKRIASQKVIDLVNLVSEKKQLK